MARKLDQQFAVKAECSDWSWTVGEGALRIFPHVGSHGEKWWTGEFLDPRGIVTVYRQGDLTRLDYVEGGRCFSRSWQRYFGDRTIARLSRAFVTDIATARAEKSA